MIKGRNDIKFCIPWRSGSGLDNDETELAERNDEYKIQNIQMTSPTMLVLSIETLFLSAPIIPIRPGLQLLSGLLATFKYFIFRIIMKLLIKSN